MAWTMSFRRVPGSSGICRHRLQGTRQQSYGTREGRVIGCDSKYTSFAAHFISKHGMSCITPDTVILCAYMLSLGGLKRDRMSSVPAFRRLLARESYWEGGLNMPSLRHEANTLVILQAREETHNSSISRDITRVYALQVMAKVSVISFRCYQVRDWDGIGVIGTSRAGQSSGFLCSSRSKITSCHSRASFAHSALSIARNDAADPSVY